MATELLGPELTEVCVVMRSYLVLVIFQIEKLEAVNKYEKEHEHVNRLKVEKDEMNEELKNLRTLEIQRDRDREAERISDKKAVRQADREKEEYRMKLVRANHNFG